MKNKTIVSDEEVNRRRGIDHIGVTVASIIHDGNGKILLMKRGPKARDERGKWDVCGGAVEFGESINDAIIREVNEEICTKPIDIQFINAGDAHRTNHDGIKTHWIWLLHAVLVDPNQVKIGEPHKISEIGWFNEATLPSPLHSQFTSALKGAKSTGIIK